MTNVKPGSEVSFQYIDRSVFSDRLPFETVYEAKEYKGKVLEVRDTHQDMLRFSTVRTHPNVERSQYLVTVKLSDNKIKNFYSGRMINLKPKRKSLVKRILGV